VIGQVSELPEEKLKNLLLKLRNSLIFDYNRGLGVVVDDGNFIPVHNLRDAVFKEVKVRWNDLHFPLESWVFSHFIRQIRYDLSLYFFLIPQEAIPFRKIVLLLVRKKMRIR
jgi:hypothetical protein